MERGTRPSISTFQIRRVAPLDGRSPNYATSLYLQSGCKIDHLTREKKETNVPEGREIHAGAVTDIFYQPFTFASL